MPTVIVVLLTGFMFYYITTGSDESSVYAYEHTMRADYDTLASYEVHTAMSALDIIYEKHSRNKISLEAAKKEGAELLRGMKYADNGYFWADDITGTNIVSSVKSYENKSRIDMQDAEGKYIIRDFLETAMNGGGYCDYKFPKKGQDTPLPKRSYVDYYKNFKWIIGTGNYVDDIDEKVAIFKAKQQRNIKIMFGLMLGLLIISVIVILRFGKKISAPINRLAKNTAELSIGNLAVDIVSKGKDEISLLAGGIKTMTEKLREIVEAIKKEATQTENAGKEMMNTSSKISAGASHLAATVEEAASALEEMQANTEQMAENSSKSKEISENITTEIQKTYTESEKAAELLKQITKEITVINDIAFQTNILALNASIQASKAGENGKGFGVIAEQVRLLAEKSKIASENIRELSIQNIKASDLSGNMIKQIIPKIKKSAQLDTFVNHSAKEQKNGIEQINKQINELNRLAQENAAIAEETEANSGELTKQAGHLPQLIHFFKN
ncbi:MAG: cache domain-containing protein [Bacteroidota bacterium]|nr:cache domain-containing protein [Bacteroidota bacterium]